MLHWIFSTGEIKSSIHVSLLLLFAIFSFLLWLRCARKIVGARMSMFGHLANCSRLIFMGLAVFSLCRPVFLWVIEGSLLSLQVLGPSSVGLLVQNLAWTVWRQVTIWTDEVYGSFQCCSFRFLESSAHLGCFWSALTILVWLEARLQG